jgi:hypothetical protein
MFFVDDREPYRQADEASFWELGERDLDHVLGTVGARIEAGDTVIGVGRLTRVRGAGSRWSAGSGLSLPHWVPMLQRKT